MIENTLKSAATEANKFFCWETLFRRETHYLAISVILSLCTTAFFHLTDAELIAITEQSKFINFFSKLPATKLPAWAEGIDVDTWNAYYVAQFSTSVVHFLLGVIGSFFLPATKYESYVKDVSWPLIIISQLCFLLILAIVIFSHRIAEGYPIPINYWQTKWIFHTLALTWLFASMVFFMGAA